MLPIDMERSLNIKKILDDNGYTKREIGVAIIDLKQTHPHIFGYNMDHFIYPASVYKIFIGAEVLRQIETGALSLEQNITIKSPNDVDTDARIFPGDTRKLLTAGDVVTIDHLLALMLERSDNTASNTLIDLVSRESITENIVHKYNWHGSEVTRKFLDRVKEHKPYQYCQTTLTCARHIAEFFYLVENEKLISPFVSNKLKEYMLNWKPGMRTGLNLSNYISYYRKGGYLENNLYNVFSKSYYKQNFTIKKFIKSILGLIKAIVTKHWAIIRWVNDAGVVKGANSHYVISVFSVNKQINSYKKFGSEKLAKLIYEYMESIEHQSTTSITS